MKVWVVMGNDYPDAVFSSEKAADDFIAEKKREHEAKAHHEGGAHWKIYWRAYEFDLRP
jgi:hypothetical protein